MKKILLVLILSTLSTFASYAQVTMDDVEKSVKVHFRPSETKLDVDYMDNRSALTKFAQEVKMYYDDPSARFGQVQIISGVSPCYEEGVIINFLSLFFLRCLSDKIFVLFRVFFNDYFAVRNEVMKKK